MRALVPMLAFVAFYFYPCCSLNRVQVVSEATLIRIPYDDEAKQECINLAGRLGEGGERLYVVFRANQRHG